MTKYNCMKERTLEATVHYFGCPFEENFISEEKQFSEADNEYFDLTVEYCASSYASKTRIEGKLACENKLPSFCTEEVCR